MAENLTQQKITSLEIKRRFSLTFDTMIYLIEVEYRGDIQEIDGYSQPDLQRIRDAHHRRLELSEQLAVWANSLQNPGVC